MDVINANPFFAILLTRPILPSFGVIDALFFLEASMTFILEWNSSLNQKT